MNSKIIDLKNKTVRIFSVLLIACLLILSITGCSDDQSAGQGGDNPAAGTSIEKMNATDIYGETVNGSYFRDYKLTLVNVMSTSCNPCMTELPYLMELSNELKDEGVGFIGINMDIDRKGNPDETSAETMQKMKEENKGEMEIVFPDSVLIENVLLDVDAIPYTFFVDENGKVVGSSFMGAHGKEDWKKIISGELENVK